MKKIKRCLGLFLSLILIFECFTVPLFAKEVQPESKDLYADKYGETLEYDGEIYEFFYYYNVEQQRCIRICNLNTGEVDVVVANPDQTVDYIQDINIVIEDARAFAQNTSRTSQWKKIKTTSEVITGIDTMSAMVFVAGVAALIGAYMTATAVLSAMGTAAVNYIISRFERATVVTTIYKANTTLVTQFEYVWKLTPLGGSTYGPYVYDTPST
ncbi:MAG: hypothetical protein EGR77_03805 [Pseudobutyrivibrio sp.]|nr:hypothetical protein [Pseudobutyrivibrio sp.]